MEALCLKPGQTAADSRGDAYQLPAMLRPGGEREGKRERGRERERGGLQYRMLNEKIVSIKVDIKKKLIVPLKQK